MFQILSPSAGLSMGKYIGIYLQVHMASHAIKTTRFIKNFTKTFAATLILPSSIHFMIYRPTGLLAAILIAHRPDDGNSTHL
jgi:hypothetical protein